MCLVTARRGSVMPRDVSQAIFPGKYLLQLPHSGPGTHTVILSFPTSLKPATILVEFMYF